MIDGKQPVQVQHKWLWAISPVNSDVAFVAHCRQCNSTYTQRLYVAAHGGTNGSVDLPEWGCKAPMGFQ